jgi:hypothetical protein
VVFGLDFENTDDKYFEQVAKNQTSYFAQKVLFSLLSPNLYFRTNPQNQNWRSVLCRVRGIVPIP